MLLITSPECTQSSHWIRGIEVEDEKDDSIWLANKIIQLRIFQDEKEVMNKSIMDVDGEIIVVSQFTLHAKTKKGNRPDFGDSMQSEMAESFFQQFVSLAANKTRVQSGIFGAHKEVESINDGPATFIFGH